MSNNKKKTTLIPIQNDVRIPNQLDKVVIFSKIIRFILFNYLEPISINLIQSAFIYKNVLNNLINSLNILMFKQTFLI